MNSKNRMSHHEHLDAFGTVADIGLCQSDKSVSLESAKIAVEIVPASTAEDA